jgi:hypothetical protein
MKRARVDEAAETSPDHVTKGGNNGAKIPSVRVSKTVKACKWQFFQTTLLIAMVIICDGYFNSDYL